MNHENPEELQNYDQYILSNFESYASKAKRVNTPSYENTNLNAEFINEFRILQDYE